MNDGIPTDEVDREGETSQLVPYSSLSRTERHSVIINGGARFVLGRLWSCGAAGGDLDRRPEAMAQALVRDSR